MFVIYTCKKCGGRKETDVLSDHLLCPFCNEKELAAELVSGSSPSAAPIRVPEPADDMPLGDGVDLSVEGSTANSP